MAGRFPFDSQGHQGQNPLHNAQVRAALGIGSVDEALYLQRQQEMHRDFQIRQILLQEQIDQQNRLDSMLHEHQLKAIGEHLGEFPDLQQHYRSLLLNEQFQRHEERNLLRGRAQIQQDLELRRRHMAGHLAQPPGHPQSSAASQSSSEAPTARGVSPQQQAQLASQQQLQQQSQGGTGSRLRDLAADSLAGNAVKRSDLDKRAFSKPEDDPPQEPSSGKRAGKARSDTHEGSDMERKPKAKPRAKRGSASGAALATPVKKQNSTDEMSIDEESPLKPSAQALLDFATASANETQEPSITNTTVVQAALTPLGTLSDLLEAAAAENQTDTAAETLLGIKKHVEWSDSGEEEDEDEDETDRDARPAVPNGESIDLPGFHSVLPQLPEEPEVVIIGPKKKRKFKSLLDDDSVDAGTVSKSKSDQNKVSKKETKATEEKTAEVAVVEYPYPIDTWWPSVSSIRRERKAAGDPLDEDEFTEDPHFADPEAPFRANTDKIFDRFANEVEPGVLEKIPQCKIHRMLMKKRKNPSAPELVYCWQVTELYPNDIMVCCSLCGTWRHAACGGHYKPYSVRECIHTPFTSICDRCHVEEKILQDHPHVRNRIDRQRTEQIRRGLATSAAMRQASFSKHGGTYKWPLGSVSATHIGGHTRSVHSRHDKAEKQWTDMATRLGRGYGYRPKERVKVRTKELERLLVSVEDAEGHTDRHNMMLFLLQDTAREYPVGFEVRRRNIFDPEEDEMTSTGGDNEAQSFSNEDVVDGNYSESGIDDDDQGEREPSTCARSGCTKSPRFDSLFCSDSCGVSTLESDLLRTFQYASDIHPSMLRN